MFWVYVLCGCFVLANGYLREMELPVYSPPSQDVILSKYFRGRTREAANRNKKSIAGDSEKFQKAIDFMKNDLSANITFLKKEMVSKNAIEIERKKPLTQFGKVTRLKARKQSRPIPAETTTYRYPTATYSVEKYEKLKAAKRNRARVPSEPAPILKPPLFAYESRDSQSNNVKTKRGSTKWKDSNAFPDYRKIREENEFVDKFLEEALMRYLISSDLEHGNVSVKTFTEILKNITRSKPTPRKFSLYDENRESRIKFRKEFSSRKKNENGIKPNGLLEKRLQRRLERLQISNGNKTVPHFRKYSQANATAVRHEGNGNISPTETDAATTTETTTTEIFSDSATEVTTLYESSFSRNASSEPTTTEETIRISTENPAAGKNESELKLSVAETVYYRKRHFPVRSLIVELDKTGVIPGVPEVDYPMYSYPPATGFKCPNTKGQRPKMMADVEARCQVFYICTGDGPAAAMLCPNGTMFNENVLVCDWWYNVDC